MERLYGKETLDFHYYIVTLPRLMQIRKALVVATTDQPAAAAEASAEPEEDASENGDIEESDNATNEE